MPRYRVVPTQEGGRGFGLWLDRDRVAEVVALSKSEFEVRLGKNRYRLVTSSNFGTKYQLLDSDSRTLASAQRPNPISPRYEIKTPGGTVLEITPVATFGRKYHVVQDELIVGLIDPDDLTTHVTMVELPKDLGIAEVVFLIWVHREATTSQ